MDERIARSIIYVGTPIFFAALASMPVLQIQDNPELFFTLLGVLWSAAAILALVRFFNSRTDPRRAKPPPDPP
ncbi:MAG: hypothetical protein HY290_24415 [Planctomycetia bacterium]|nr:hypothetical protein [Planctomycetia bacterium]